MLLIAINPFVFIIVMDILRCIGAHNFMGIHTFL